MSDAASAPNVPIKVYAEESGQPGVFVLAKVECPALGVVEAHIVLEPMRDRLAIATPCGATVAVSLSQALMHLAQQMRGDQLGLH